MNSYKQLLLFPLEMLKEGDVVFSKMHNRWIKILYASPGIDNGLYTRYTWRFTGTQYTTSAFLYEYEIYSLI